MLTNGWLSLPTRQAPESAEPGWLDVVVGYDFSLLGPADIQRWLRMRGARGEAGARLISLAGEELLDFGIRLWEACEEELGCVPRPGVRAWSEAQDRWRKALLREALEADLTEGDLAAAIEHVYDRVGCPEDMLGLWSYRAPWQKAAARVDFEALSAFLGGTPARMPAVA